MPSRLTVLSCASAVMALAACALPPANPTPAALPAPLVAASAPAANLDLAMLNLANRAGCTACHQVDRPAAPEDEDDSAPSPRPPVGPFWRDVANRYRNDPLALQRLTAAVANGSAPLRPHWRDVAGLAMPPNRTLLTDAETQRLLGWILALPEAPQDPPAEADVVRP